MNATATATIMLCAECIEKAQLNYADQIGGTFQPAKCDGCEKEALLHEHHKQWCFAWRHDPYEDADADDVFESKVFRAASLEQACELMMDFLAGEEQCRVDYEVAALHVPYDHQRHEEHFQQLKRGNPLYDGGYV